MAVRYTGEDLGGNGQAQLRYYLGIYIKKMRKCAINLHLDS
jgi:hypothetical protein